MKRVRSRDTKPEMVVRSLLRQMGYRYRVCRKELPGKPDIVFQRQRKIVLVHGCFWHLHDCIPPHRRFPKSNCEFWRSKLEGNKRRDEANVTALRASGWQGLVVWACQLADEVSLCLLLDDFLDGLLSI